MCPSSESVMPSPRQPLPRCPNDCDDAEIRKLGSSVTLDAEDQAPHEAGGTVKTLYQCLECGLVFEVQIERSRNGGTRDES